MITMRFTLVASVVGIVIVLALAVPSAMAQVYQPRPAGYGSPPVSPYINLLRPGQSPAINYYGIVRPTVNFQNSIAGLQQQETQTNAQLAATDQALLTLPQTGHSAVFMSYSHYFGGTGGALPVRGASAAATSRGTGRSAPTSGYGR
jgi:hypothetical protein